MKTLMIVGAGFLQTPVIKKAKELGYITISVDMDKNAEGFKYSDYHKVINIVDKEACLDYAREMKIDGVLTAATDYGVLTSSYIAQELGLPGLDYNVAKIIKNKYNVRKILYGNKIDDINQFYEITNISDLVCVKEQIQYPVMVKPCDGSGSKAAVKANNYEEIISACKAALDVSISNRVLIESFVEGREYGVESFVLNAQIYVLGIMKKLMTMPPYYAELGHSMPSGLKNELENKIKKVVTKAINALHINYGAVNMDLLITENEQIFIVDIGTRMGGNLIGSHIIPQGTGIDYMETLINSAVGEKVDLTPKDPSKIVSTRLLALTPGKVMQLPSFAEIENQCQVKIYHHLKKGNIIREYQNNLDGCGYVVAIADSTIEADKRAEDAKNLINAGITRE